MESAYCTVRNGSSNKKFYASYLKGLKLPPSLIFSNLKRHENTTHTTTWFNDVFTIIFFQYYWYIFNVSASNWYVHRNDVTMHYRGQWQWKSKNNLKRKTSHHFFKTHSKLSRRKTIRKTVLNYNWRTRKLRIHLKLLQKPTGQTLSMAIFLSWG